MFKWLPKQVYDLYLRYFGRYTLEDPRPIAKSAPYTFYLPSESDLTKLQPGDLVKLIFCSHPEAKNWNAERMWVEIKEINSNGISGILDNEPSDMPQLKAGAQVQFQSFNIVDIIPVTEGEDAKPERQYWERCLVDDCVLNDNTPVHFLYREDPDTPEGDKFPDSGWRIRGDYRGLTDEQIDARKMSYIALGKVLNADDSWLHLIDEPVGSGFIRDFATNIYLPEASQ